MSIKSNRFVLLSLALLVVAGSILTGCGKSNTVSEEDRKAYEAIKNKKGEDR